MTEAEKNSLESLQEYFKIHELAQDRLAEILGGDQENRRIAIDAADFCIQASGKMGELLLEVMTPSDKTDMMIPIYHAMLTRLMTTVKRYMDGYVMNSFRDHKETMDDILEHFWDGFKEEETWK